MDEGITCGWKRAERDLGVSPEQVREGLEMHSRIFACDTFGFLPRTFSRSACATLEQMVENGATREELDVMSGVLGASCHVYDPDCRRQFLDAVKATGLGCTVLTIGSEKDLHHSIHRISWYIQLFDRMREHLLKATCVEDIGSARDSGRLAVVCSANCVPAHGGLSDGVDAHYWIDIFHRFGVRVMHLTYNRRNWVGDGCLEPADAGLSLHGRDVVRHLNELGIVVDTPHCGRQTTLDGAKFSKAPIMATHATCQGVYDHPRGKSDDELKAIADTGGLVGICIIPFFLGEHATLKDLMEHVDYAVNLVGPEHVAIGTDRAYTGPWPDGRSPFDPETRPKRSAYSRQGWWGAWETAPDHPDPTTEQWESLAWTNWPYYTVGLLAMGYGEEEITKILGTNLLRVLRNVQQAGACA